MRIWFDTEFWEDGRVVDLISIGLVRADGAEFYAEVPNALEICARDPWQLEHVAPHLLGGAAVMGRPEIAESIRSFAGERPEFWAYNAPYDWIGLNQLYGRLMDRPQGWPKFCRDLRVLRDLVGNPEMPPQDGDLHHALADALWNRQAHLFLEERYPLAAPEPASPDFTGPA